MSDLDVRPIRFAQVGDRSGTDRGEVFEKARQEGFATGHAAGREAALRELEAERAALMTEAAETVERELASVRRVGAGLARAAASLDTARNQTAWSGASRLREMAIELAEQIVGHELGEADRRVRSMIARVGEIDDPVRVRVHPGDLSATQALVAVPVVSDPALTPGDVIVDLAAGSIDARVSGMFERARAAFAAGVVEE